MTHLEILNNGNYQHNNDLVNKFTGRYYTHESLIDIIINRFFELIDNNILDKSELNVIDPFSGDGRLVYYFIKRWQEKSFPNIRWQVELWDIDEEGHKIAKERIEELINNGINIICNYRIVDTFTFCDEFIDSFDIVITNPPWEILKPDNRELKKISSKDKDKYVNLLREYDSLLSIRFPLSQPDKKFAGWGTNLSRVGLDVSLSLLKDNGHCLIILPASFFADKQSKKIRKEVFTKTSVKEIIYFPAGAKMFGKADVDSSILILSKRNLIKESFSLAKYTKDLKLLHLNSVFYHQINHDDNYVIPISLDPKGLEVLKKIRGEGHKWTLEEDNNHLWIGRELDETNIDYYLSDNKDGIKFIRGRMIDRFQIRPVKFQFFKKDNFVMPVSVKYERIVWRDISRTSQKRRLIATIIPANIIAGNSLGVCYYKDDDSKALKILLGIMNSLCFEFQIRSNLGTGHISLSALRNSYIPTKNELLKNDNIYKLVELSLDGNYLAEMQLEAIVAKDVYKLSIDDFKVLLNSFEKLSEEEKKNIIAQY